MLLGIVISIVLMLIPVFIAWKLSQSRHTITYSPTLDEDSYPSITPSKLDDMRSQIAQNTNGKSFVDIGGNMVEIDKETGRPICG